MVWPIAAVCLVGLLLGLKFRIPALLATTLVLIVIVAAEVLGSSMEAVSGLFYGLLLVLTLHFSYVFGVLLRVLYGSAASRRPNETEAPPGWHWPFSHSWHRPFSRTPDRTR